MLYDHMRFIAGAPYGQMAKFAQVLGQYIYKHTTLTTTSICFKFQNQRWIVDIYLLYGKFSSINTIAF